MRIKRSGKLDLKEVNPGQFKRMIDAKFKENNCNWKAKGLETGPIGNQFGCFPLHQLSEDLEGLAEKPSLSEEEVLKLVRNFKTLERMHPVTANEIITVVFSASDPPNSTQAGATSQSDGGNGANIEAQ